MEARTAFRTCPFCEATCGLAVTVRGDEVVKVRGDADDVFSRGFLCPKGVAIKDLHDDPDRLRTPLVRDAGGELRPASWDEAFAVVGARLAAVRDAHGPDAVAVYIGNPAAHGLAALLYGRVLVKALGTRSVYSASTVDQRPKEISSALMFGGGAVGPDPRRRPHAAPADARRQPARLQRLADDRAGHARAAARRSGRAAASSSSSTRAAAGPPRRPTSTTRSGPAPTRTCCSRSSHVLFEEGLARAGPARRADRRHRRGARARAAVHARGGRAASAGSARRRSAAWRASWPPPRRRPSTAGSARRRRSSGRWPRGSSTCSTSSPATSTARAARCSRAPRRGSATAPASRAAAAGSRWAAGTRACAACPRSSASCRSRRSPRRWRCRARARSGR